VITDLTPKVDKKAPLGKAIYYWTRQQATLCAFLDDGRFPISNAHVERLLRVVSTFRKNSLFVGSLDAGAGPPRPGLLLRPLTVQFSPDMMPSRTRPDKPPIKGSKT
jgi:hypothetical protein